MNESPFVEIRQLHFSRRTQVIFDGLDIDIERGKITAIMGPSGTGKTTLLQLIGGQLKPSFGYILVNGQNIHELSRRELYRARRMMGMLFQNSGLFTDLNVFDNVAFPIREHTNLSESMIRNLVLIKLEAVGLRNAKYLMPSELSGGMARRVALARALALDPEIMMYDEPFTGQDPISLGVISQLIKKLNQILGITSVVVSHDVEQTLAIADYIYVLAKGKVIGQGTPQDLLANQGAEVQQFIRGLPDGPVPFHYSGLSFAKDWLGEDHHG